MPLDMAAIGQKLVSLGVPVAQKIFDARNDQSGSFGAMHAKFLDGGKVLVQFARDFENTPYQDYGHSLQEALNQAGTLYETVEKAKDDYEAWDISRGVEAFNRGRQWAMGSYNAQMLARTESIEKERLALLASKEIFRADLKARRDKAVQGLEDAMQAKDLDRVTRALTVAISEHCPQVLIDSAEAFVFQQTAKQVHQTTLQVRKQLTSVGTCSHSVEVPARSPDPASSSASPVSPDNLGLKVLQHAPAADVSDPRVNLKELADLLKKSDDGINSVKGKDAIIILGKTGAGKTTLMQGIAGRRLILKPGIEIAHDAVDPHPDFEIGHEAQSQTKKIKHYRRDNVMYLDFPGFDDTSGVEIEIFTAVAFKKIAQLCRRLRFVVLINCSSLTDTRGVLLRDEVSLFSSFVQFFDAYKYAFTFIFSHTNKIASMTESMHVVRMKIIPKVQRTLAVTEKKHTQVCAVLEWIIECLQNDYPFVDVFHPEKSHMNSLCAAVERFEREDFASRQVFPAIGLRQEDSGGDVVLCGMTEKTAALLNIEVGKHIRKFGPSAPEALELDHFLNLE